MLANQLRSSSLLCRRFATSPLAVRFYRVRPTFLPSCESRHPETRRSQDEVYVHDFLQRHQHIHPGSGSDINLRRRMRIKYGRALTKHPLHEENRCFSHKHRWNEFRRKLVLGAHAT
ncbi:uncharacterized protein LOC115634185 [Scaptodrosophila lebanonensis]|uniref:Uncharacterized protein LOC115634185 n=1 Tax=Drosophila lebanonensis TaxID=7225 RepID=A0A6J2UK76_DROLE|nr:uncharacterized protein LOC115634185 [Scaptodrosophila lebanonensis]